ncbi:MAG: choice-of-anchor D domain-containing protein [Acidobacteriota bacterium]
MMRKISSLLLCTALAAAAQILVETPEGFRPVGATYAMGSTSPGDPVDVRFRAPAGANLAVAGVGFAVRDIQSSGDVTVRVLPEAEGSYSANLSAGNSSVILRGVGLAVAAVVHQGQTLFQGGIIDLGSVEVGSPATTTVLLQNRTPRPLTIPTLSTDFAFATPIPLPVLLDPGAELALRLTATPSTPGLRTGTLSVAGRTFQLRVTGTLPRLSEARILTDAATVTSGQQVRLRVEFAEPAASLAAGTLELEFSGDDPAVRLTTGRLANFSVPAGARLARFGDSDDIVLQTGTVAGTIRLIVKTPGRQVQREFITQFQPVVVEEAKASREGSTLVVALSGFDNSRGASSLSFQFADKAGNPLGAAFTVSPENEWRNYFQANPLGGLFRLRAVFPVAGDASLVNSVTVAIANAVGRTEVGKLNLP